MTAKQPVPEAESTAVSFKPGSYRTAQQAHNAVTQAQSSLLPQEIQYAEHKVCEALSYLRQVQDQLNQDIAPETDRV